jgi:uncharacterized protein (DUF427 family)
MRRGPTSTPTHSHARGGKRYCDLSPFRSEANYPPVQYIPRKVVDMAALARSETVTYCPYKVEATYFSIPAGGEQAVDAIWTYEAPFEAVADIKDHVAFYSERVDAIEQLST